MKSFMWNCIEKAASTKCRKPPKHLYFNIFSYAEREHPSAGTENSSHVGEILCKFSH